MFAFLANVRNQCGITPIAEPRGLPDDHTFEDDHGFGNHDNVGSKYPCGIIDGHNKSWLTLKELIDFDYSKGCNGRTYRELLSEKYFKNLEKLATLGEPENIRIIFAFDC